jgi:hypothetical protein
MWLAIFVILIIETEATTEWFGDQRMHLNPPKNPAFYDIVYDDVGKVARELY